MSDESDGCNAAMPRGAIEFVQKVGPSALSTHLPSDPYCLKFDSKTLWISQTSLCLFGFESLVRFESVKQG
ncbi:hypothetical protein L3X38_034654 [Prunus dulcis]|uniref:Uncharacterized protein n=1 Tax=Prunus dulcis TaxID=3755 RepID=A0AAD4VI88_PRUDU|nr:hypothetical protein L3X38_034654 [Prunus dulcis]